MSVSVIIAVFNGATTLQRCLDSVFSQKYATREIIIIDGQSTDKTMEIVLKNKDAISYWSSAPDLGVYDAWNKALAASRSDWVCFLGADDWFRESESLGKLVVAGLASDADLVLGHMNLFDTDGHMQEQKPSRWDLGKLRRYQNICNPSMLYRRRLFERYGTFNACYRIAGDYEFLLRLGAETRIAHVDSYVVNAENAGISRRNALRTLWETRQIQAAHPDIGPRRALANYGLALVKLFVRRVLCGRS